MYAPFQELKETNVINFTQNKKEKKIALNHIYDINHYRSLLFRLMTIIKILSGTISFVSLLTVPFT
jgi:hypothetical protein